MKSSRVRRCSSKLQQAERKLITDHVGYRALHAVCLTRQKRHHLDPILRVLTFFTKAKLTRNGINPSVSARVWRMTKAFGESVGNVASREN